MRVDTSECPVCKKGLDKYYGDKIYKCGSGKHILALEFVNNQVVWVDIITKKEYSAKIVE